MKRIGRAAAIGVLATQLATVSAAAAPPKVRNVILMIADGAGYHMIDATRLWAGKPLEVDDARFQKAAMSVHALRHADEPRPGPDGLRQDPLDAYSSAKSWNTAPIAAAENQCPAVFSREQPTPYAQGFAGYSWNCATHPDSANTMSAIATGVKSYNNAINVDGEGNPVRSAAEAAVSSGRLAGVVTTAQLTDATPAAGGGGHAVSRYFRPALTAELLARGGLSVLGGAGSPDWDDDARPRDPADKARFEWIAPELWADLKGGTDRSRANGSRWTLVEDRAAVQAIADGRAAPPDKLLIVAKANGGIAQYRGGLKPGTEEPFATPIPEAQPTLTEMTRAALARLGAKPFFLVIEESNTDRAAHANNLGRVIEARLSFEAAVRAVVDWVDRPDSPADWSNTLLIATADHDHLLFGPDADRVPFQPPQPNPAGPGHLPAHRWFSNNHSNQLVPIFARGAGARALIGQARKVDRWCDAQQRCFGRGRYLDNTDLGRFLLATMERRP